MSDRTQKAEYPHSIFRYIECNMAEAMDTELLTAIGAISCAQLYRDFYSLTGHSVKEYIRKRRLSNALALIKTSDVGFTDIALQCGYSSHQALCRTVRETLGLTLSAYKSGETHYFFPPWRGKPPHSVRVSSETIPRTRRVLYYHSSASNIEHLAVGALLRALPDFHGRIFGRNGEQAGSRFCYELYLTDIGDDRKLRLCDFEPSQDAPCTTAVFATTTVGNDARKINAAWDYLYAEWLQDSMFEYTGEPYYEEYLIKKDRPAKLRLYLPIQRRSANPRIRLVSNPGLRFIVSKGQGRNAERIASQTVVHYLTAHNPRFLRAAREFYLRKERDACVCGVRATADLSIPDAENLERFVTDRADYLVLESSVMGDYGRYADLLLAFARDSGMTADASGVFAVYDTSEGFDNPSIQMYCPVKIEKK